MLKEGDFLLKFLGIVGECVSAHDILLLCRRYGFPFVVEELAAAGGAWLGAIEHDLRRIVEEDSCGIVR